MHYLECTDLSVLCIYINYYTILKRLIFLSFAQKSNVMDTVEVTEDNSTKTESLQKVFTQITLSLVYIIISLFGMKFFLVHTNFE